MATNHVAGAITAWDHVAASDINSGDVVVMDTVIGIALNSCLDTETVAVGVSGTWRLPMGAINLAQGAAVDWDGTEIIASIGSQIGVVRDAATSGDGFVNVQIG